MRLTACLLFGGHARCEQRFSSSMCIYGIPELRRLGIPFLVLALLPSALSLSSIYAGSDSREESISDVPIREQVPLLLEALPWDRTFQKRIKKGFHFGILYTDSDTSQEALREVMTLFSRWSSGSTGKKGNSRSVAVNAHEFKWSGPAALARALDSQPIAALYILPGNEAHLEEIIKVVDERDGDYIANFPSVL